jgi:hypothetical protein
MVIDLSGLCGLVGLAVVYMALSREPLHKDVERLRRDIEHRAHTSIWWRSWGTLFRRWGTYKT